MKAMIFAAGLGTRLRPLTDSMPKALVAINGVTLLERALWHLQSAGVDEIIVNAHHFAEEIAAFLRTKRNFGLRVEISFEEILLDTGGGLKKAAWFFDDGAPFFVHNADVISELELAAMYRFHVAQGALATLAVKPRNTKRQLVFDEAGKLCGRQEIVGGAHTNSPLEGGQGGVGAAHELNQTLNSNNSASTIDTPVKGGVDELRSNDGTMLLAFDGIHVISPALLGMIEEAGAFSIINTYLRLAAAGKKILAFRSDGYYWRDVGKREELEQIARELAGREVAARLSAT